MENCYFYIDGNDDDNKRVRVMCVECHDSKHKVGWFYDAERQGYGPFDYICSKCERTIHSQPKEKDENKQVAT